MRCTDKSVWFYAKRGTDIPYVVRGGRRKGLRSYEPYAHTDGTQLSTTHCIVPYARSVPHMA
eukprot:2320663-Rhodomonas_salina.1